MPRSWAVFSIPGLRSRVHAPPPWCCHRIQTAPPPTSTYIIISKYHPGWNCLFLARMTTVTLNFWFWISTTLWDAPPPKTDAYSQQGSDFMLGKVEDGHIHTYGLSLTLLTFGWPGKSYVTRSAWLHLEGLKSMVLLPQGRSCAPSLGRGEARHLTLPLVTRAGWWRRHGGPGLCLKPC